MTSLKVSKIGYPDDSKADCYGLVILSDRSSIQASILPDKDEGFWQAKHSDTFTQRAQRGRQCYGTSDSATLVAVDPLAESACLGSATMPP